jgi:hypothetical protein
MGLGDWVVYHALSEFDMAKHGSSIRPKYGGYTRVPSGDELKKYFAQSGFPNGYTSKISWCGVFATYVLHKVCPAIGWQGAKIVDLSGGKNLKLVRSNRGMKPGDVAVRDSSGANHHFIVLAEPSGGPIYSVDGNHGGPGNPVLFYGRFWKNNVAAVDGYYRLL